MRLRLRIPNIPVKFGDTIDPFVNGQLAGVTTITSLFFGELLTIKIREAVMLFVAGFISPGTE